MYNELQSGMADVGTVLVLEDEMLVAAVVEDCLRDLGATDVVLCMTVREAESALATRQIDCAVLDVRIGSAVCFPIVDKLAEWGIPFVFATASMPEELPERYLGRARLSKPFSNEQLVEALLAAIAADGRGLRGPRTAPRFVIRASGSGCP